MPELRGSAFGDTITPDFVSGLVDTFPFFFIRPDGNPDVLYGNGGNDTLDGGGGDDTIFGGADDDLVSGSDGNDFLDGGTGEDTLHGGVGNDTLIGGDTGINHLHGGEGDDLIVGGLNQFVYGGTGTDTLDIRDFGEGVFAALSTGAIGPTAFGVAVQRIFDVEDIISGDWNDVLIGSGVANRIDAGGGDDLIDGLGGNDSLNGGNGNDTLNGGNGSDTLNGGNGNDSLNGGEGNDTLNGGSGSNLVSGGAGNDLIVSTATANDTLNGNDGNDRFDLNARSSLIGLTVDGGAGSDIADLRQGLVTLDTVARFVGVESLDVFQTVIIGTAGNDILDFSGFATTALGTAQGVAVSGGAGDDLIAGSRAFATNDILEGSAGADTLRGFHGDDRLNGGTENDFLNGHAGTDVLFGGDGNDVLVGGKGADVLHGGLGNDRFVFSFTNESAGASVDRIEAGTHVSAFDGPGAAIGDLIDLRRIDANVEVAGNQAFIFGGSGIGRIRVIEKDGNSVVLGNTDSDPQVEFRLVIVDGGVLASQYTADDFLL